MKNNPQILCLFTFFLLFCLVNSYTVVSCPCATSINIISNCSACSATCFLYNNLTSSLGQCWTCIQHCISCTTPYDCSACDSPYFLSPSASCLSCPQLYGANCSTCDGTACLTCLLGSYLNTTNGNKSCVPCAIYKCLTCSNFPTCTLCDNGYYLDNAQHLCFPCEYPCNTCTALPNNCSSCINDFYAYNGTNCKLCSYTLIGCNRCSSNSTCIQCSSYFYYLSAGACHLCHSPCQICLSLTQCLTCDSNIYLFNQTTFLCQFCNIIISNCYTCLAPSICLSCQLNYYLTNPPNSCLLCQDIQQNCSLCSQTLNGPICIACDNTFYIFNGTCNKCPDQCGSCTSLTHCTSCVDTSYFLLNFKCIACYQAKTNCQTCILNTTTPLTINCTYCVNYTIQQLGNCQQCNLGYYAGITIPQTCILCDHPCNSCLSSTLCIDCVEFYTISLTNSSQCVDLCGDFVIITDECDHGLNIPNDGCSNECQIQNSFVCFYSSNSLNGTTVNQSTCSYYGNVELNLESIQKPQLFQNKVIFTFYLNPYLYGLPGTNDQVFSQQQLRSVFQLSNLTKISNYIVKASQNGIVKLQVYYNQTISLDQFELFVNFSYLSSSMNLMEFALTPNVFVNFNIYSQFPNTLFGVFYSPDQISQSKIIYYLATFVSIFALMAFILSLFTKQISGIQLIVVCQFAYLSLLWYQQTLNLPSYCLKQLIYSTGYNIQPSFQTVQLINYPPQSKVLSFNPQKVSDNLNLMSLLYLFPLIAVLVFIPFKAKCIRKLTYIQWGHKWVDLLLGEFQLYGVIFNYQLFLINLITYFQSGKNIKNYTSTMIIFLALITTFMSYLGYIFKPQIYGVFRTSFRYNQIYEKKNQQLNIQQLQETKLLKQKFQKQKKCLCLSQCCKKIANFFNQNYFWKNHRDCYNFLAANHYFILVLMITMNSIELVTPSLYYFIFAFNGTFTIYLIIIRPYSTLSNKLRAIYFSCIILFISYARYHYNVISNQFNFIIPLLIVVMLTIGMIWTFFNLIIYLIQYIKQILSDRHRLIGTIFSKEFVINHHQQLKEDEKKIMKKLMKKYEKLQFKYNFNNVRDQLLNNTYSNKLAKNQEIQMVQIQNQKIADKNSKMTQQKINKQEQKVIQKTEMNNKIGYQKQNNTSQIKNFNENIDTIKQQQKSVVSKSEKKKVNKKQMLKLLSLDNFQKYQQKYLFQGDSRENSFKKNRNYYDDQQKEQLKSKDSEQSIKDKNVQDQSSYVSVEPQNIQQAKEKIIKERLILQENQHLRYQRALKFIKKDGLTIDQDLVEDNYQYI